MRKIFVTKADLPGHLNCLLYDALQKSSQAVIWNNEYLHEYTLECNA